MADNKEEMTIDTMSDQYFDVLKEIGNIGAGNATTALSTMLGMKVDMKVPQVRLMEFKEVGTTMGGEDQIVAGIYLVVDGDIHGSIMFVQRKESARAMVSKLMGMPSEGEDFSEMELSALKEIGNVITGAYLNSLSTLTNLTIYPSVPNICIDMAGAILSVPAIEFGAISDKMLLIQTDFTDDDDLSGFFILVPDEESDAKILHALGF
jgi:chemotaxis protein CheC